jgi:autotransporter-associated beta strand protein
MIQPIRQYLRYISVGIAAAVMVTAAAATATSATRTWDGGNQFNNNWTAPANWAGDVAPAPGDELIFPDGVADTSTVNNFPAGTKFNKITFQATYVVDGNRIVIGSAIEHLGAGNAYIYADLTLDGGPLATGTVTLNVPQLGAILLLGGVINSDGAVPSAMLRKNGSGSVRLHGANSYAGATTVAEGVLYLFHAQALGSPSSGTTILSAGHIYIETTASVGEPLFVQADASGAPVFLCLTPTECTWSGPIVLEGVSRMAVGDGRTLRLSGDISGAGSLHLSFGTGIVELLGTNTYNGQTTPGNVKLGSAQSIPDNSHVNLEATGRFELNGFSETIGSLSGAAGCKVVLGGGTLTVDTVNLVPNFSGEIKGSGGVIKKGSGPLTIKNGQTFTGTMTVQAGTLILDQSAEFAGPVNVTGGILSGKGRIGGLLASGGRIEPGLSPGIITTEWLTLNAGSTLALELNGPTAGTAHDQVRVIHDIMLNGATLELEADGPDAFDVPLVIVKNDGGNAVTGTFAGLPEGAIVLPAFGRALRITYKGGDGNDIVVSPAAASYYLSEGATGAFFDTDILIANPNGAAVEATLTFLLPDGTTKVETRNVPGRSRLTVKVDEIAGLESTAVSTVVTSASGLPLVVERTMRWDAGGYGAHTEKAVTSTSKDWYFAEGAQGFFSTYLLLANPQSTPNVATVRYLRENAAAIVRTYPVEANSRFTVDASADPDLVGSSFGMHVSFDQPGVAERAMYFGVDPFWKAGHESAGVTEPSPTWFLAEGATGPFFETFVLLANPGDQPAEATVTFLPDTGVPVVKTVPVPAQGRVTLNIEAEDPSLANAAVATQVSATQPILVERAQYWPDPAPQWYEAHNSFGVTALGTKWGLAEGRSGGPEAYQTYILLANPGTVKANVTVTFLRDGQSPVEKTYEVNPRSRFNVDTGLVSELAGLHFGAVITSDQPIAVERAMYNNANGQVWAAGTNATAVPIP